MSPGIDDVPQYSPRSGYVAWDPRAYSGWVVAVAVAGHAKAMAVGLAHVATALNNLAEAIRDQRRRDQPGETR